MSGSNRHKKQKKPQKQRQSQPKEQNTITLATARQLTAIAAKRDEVANLAWRYNHLSITISMVLFLPVFNQLLKITGLNYLEYFQQSRYEEYDAIYKSRMPKTKISYLDDIEGAVTHFCKMVLELGIQLQLTGVRVGREDEVDDWDVIKIAKVVDDLEVKKEYLNQFNEITKLNDYQSQLINDTKLELLRHANRLVANFKGVPLIFGGNETSVYSTHFGYLIYAVLESLRTNKTMQDSLYKYIDIWAQSKSQRDLMFCNIILKIAFQYIVFMLLMNRFFPTGIFSSQLRSDKADNMLAFSEAKELIEKLDKRKISLEKATRYGSLGLGGTVLLAIAYMMTSNSRRDYYYEEIVGPLIFSLFAVAIAEIFPYGYRKFNDYKLHYQLNAKEKIWNALVIHKNYRPQLMRSDALYSSYFVLELPGLELKNGKAGHLFKMACHFNQIGVFSERDNVVCISAAQSITNEKINEIKTLFLKSVNRQKLVDRFIKQFGEIKKYMGLDESNFFFHQKFDQSRLPIVNGYLNLPREVGEEIINELFGKYTTTQLSDGRLRIDFSMDESIDEDKFEAGKAAIMSVMRKAAPTPSMGYAMSVDQHEKIHSKANKHKKAETEASKQEAMEEIPANEKPIEPDVYSVKWGGNLKYDSKKDTGIYPVMQGRDTSTTGFLGRIFLTSSLTENDVNDTVLYDRLNHQVKNGRLRSKGQGVKRWDSTEKDIHGKDQYTVAKIKLLGVYGDVRFWVREKAVSAEGDRLWEVFGFSPKSHRKLKRGH